MSHSLGHRGGAAPSPRANPEGSQAQDAIGKTEMAVVVPTKSPAPGEAGLRGPS